MKGEIKKVFRDDKGRIRKFEDYHCPDKNNWLTSALKIAAGALGLYLTQKIISTKKDDTLTQKIVSTKKDGIIEVEIDDSISITNKYIIAKYLKLPSQSPFLLPDSKLNNDVSLIVERFNKIEDLKSTDEIIEQLLSIVLYLHEIEEYAKQLYIKKVSLHIEKDTWNSLIEMKKKVKYSCLHLKNELIKHNIHNFPRYRKLQLSANQHRTILEITKVRTQLEHGLQLAEWLNKSSIIFNSNNINSSINLLKSSDNNTI